MFILTNRKYKLIEYIAEGGFGIVAEVEADNGSRYAIKVNFGFKCVEGMLSLRDVNFSAAVDPHPFFLAIKEISLKDPFRTRYIASFKQNNELASKLRVDSLYFIMPLGKSSLDCLFRGERYRELILCFRSVLWQITIAVEYMHAKNFMHRDIKPDNIILFNAVNNDLRIKIADFGFIKTCSNGLNTIGIQNHSYRAPEIALKCKKYTNTVDIWSLGIIFYQMLTGGNYPYPEPPNRDDNDEKLLSMMHLIFDLSNVDYDSCDMNMYRKIVRKSTNNSLIDKITTKTRETPYVELFDFFDKSDCFDLLSNMLNPSIKRYTATDCLNHPFFTKEKWSEMNKNMRDRFGVGPDGKLIVEAEDMITVTDNECRQDFFKYAEYVYYTLNGKPWFNLQIWASINDLFDRWLYHYIDTVNPDSKLPLIPKEYLIKKCYFACAFIMVKTCSTEILSFRNIFPSLLDEKSLKNSTRVKLTKTSIRENIELNEDDFINDVIKMEQELVFNIAKGNICRFTIVDYISHDQIDIDRILTLLLDDLPQYHGKSWRWLTKMYLGELDDQLKEDK